jgi:hypothetical protein
MSKYKLPVNFKDLHYTERKEVMQQYIEEQKGICYYCKCSLNEPAPIDKKVNWSLFPENFLQYSIHLQHCHKTGMTEGAVHNYCSAVLWQYENR